MRERLFRVRVLPAVPKTFYLDVLSESSRTSALLPLPDYSQFAQFTRALRFVPVAQTLRKSAFHSGLGPAFFEFDE